MFKLSAKELIKKEFSKDNFKVLYDWPDFNLFKLKEWVDKQIEDGYIKAEIGIIWSPYNDIDAITIKPYKEKLL